MDEPGDAEFALVPDNIDPNHDQARANGLWGAYMAGAWGTEWYFGYSHPHSDLTAQDWRTRDLFWDQVRFALNFFEIAGIDIHKAVNKNELIDNAWVLAKEGEYYVVYTKDVSQLGPLKLINDNAKYTVHWYNPRKGGAFISGSVATIDQNHAITQYFNRTPVGLGVPPYDQKKDWVILIKKVQS